MMGRAVSLHTLRQQIILCLLGLCLQGGMHTAVRSSPMSGISVQHWTMTEPHTHQKAKQDLLKVKARPLHHQTSNPALAGFYSARGTTPGKPHVDIQALSTQSRPYNMKFIKHAGTHICSGTTLTSHTGQPDPLSAGSHPYSTLSPFPSK